MPNKLRASGFLFSAIFLCGYFVNVFSSTVRGFPPSRVFFSQTQIMILLPVMLFLLSAFVDRLRWIQPALFLIMTPFSIVSNSRTIYGLGFIIMSILLLERANFFAKYRIIKIVGLIIYLLGIEAVSVIFAGEKFNDALSASFFTLAFGVFLWFLYKDRFVVFLKEPKPRLSLSERGLSMGERSFVTLTMAGKSQKELAFDFELSESTVRNTLSRAYKKLDIDDRIGLAIMAERFQIVD
ncbi:MAG: hypothetical protein A2Y38_18785 [Spirochaetes bacterium GWB1_59_5]|nr:MAG: hypothetical protein A2Y38_18785 [Spirochaetes bacterium GWB1_59_5]